MPLKVGILGIGFMGWIHWLAYQKNKNVQVAAICTPEANRLAGDWTDIQGNFGPPGEKVNLDGIAAYSDMDQLLADDSLDMIDICLPPAMHADAICRAAEAGKHVFCEKPLALNVDDCQRAVATCERLDRRLMVGQVLPFFVEYAYARKVIEGGEYGKLLGGTFKRVISDPQWLPHFYDPGRIGGPLFDLHVHDAHFIRLLFGMPNKVYSAGRMRNEVVDYCNSIFKFPNNDAVVSCVGGVINQQGRPFTHGFEIHLERATLQFEFAGFSDEGESMPVKLLKPDGSIERPELGDGDPVIAFAHEIDEVVSSVAAGKTSPILAGDLACDAIRMCDAQSKSVRQGIEVTVE